MTFKLSPEVQAKITAARERQESVAAQFSGLTDVQLVEAAAYWAANCSARHGTYDYTLVNAIVPEMMERLIGGGWVKIEDAPLRMNGYVWSSRYPDRTDFTGYVVKHAEDDVRCIATNSQGVKFELWHPPIRPPLQAADIPATSNRVPM